MKKYLLLFLAIMIVGMLAGCMRRDNNTNSSHGSPSHHSSSIYESSAHPGDGSIDHNSTHSENGSIVSNHGITP